MPANDPERKRAGKTAFLASEIPEVDFALVLSRVIDSVKSNPAELRNAIYEVARVKLRREAWAKSPPMDLREIGRLTLALETAIDRVEAISAKQDQLSALKSLDRLLDRPDKSAPAMAGADAVLVIDHVRSEATYQRRFIELLAYAKRISLAMAQRSRMPQSAPLRRLGLVGVVVLAAYGLFDATARYFWLRGTPADAPATTGDPTARDAQATTSTLIGGAPVVVGRPASAPDAALRPFPLPSVYGIYALSKGELYELEPLPGRVPDPRIFMSATFNKRSRTILPEGRLAFVGFRRELAASAPDRVSVRVIAQIKRAMAFSASGQATTSSLNDLWAVRNVSYEFRVAPVPESSEMIIMRSDNPDFILSPGRYGLVLNGIAYDFSVAGEATEPAQCLERTQASNGTFYSECRKP